MNEASEYTRAVVRVLKRVPRGRVATYGMVALLAGNPLAARQVVRILHTRSKSDKLPWHRIINKAGYIALRSGTGFEEQRILLAKEGIETTEEGRIDLKIHLWRPRVPLSSPKNSR